MMKARHFVVAALMLGYPAAHGRAETAIPGVVQTEDRERALTCLAAAIAYEAGVEPIEGRQAVAEVVLNRVRDPAFPKTVCGVVFGGANRRTGCQFSFTCDGSLKRRLPKNLLVASRLVAAAALDGLNPQRASGATHYHADYVSPYWAPSLIRVGKIGAHIFYRAPTAQDRSDASVRYAARGEPAIPALGLLANTPAPNAEPVAAQAAAKAKAPAAFAPWGLLPVAKTN